MNPFQAAENRGASKRYRPAHRYRAGEMIDTNASRPPAKCLQALPI